MQAQDPQEVSPQTATALIEHLRQHPEEARRPPIDLARRFDVDESFVRSVLDGVRPPTIEPPAPRDRRPAFTFHTRLWVAFVQLFDRWTQNPTRFVLATTLLCIGAIVVGSRIPHFSKVTYTGLKITIEDTVTSLAMLVAFFLQMACYFHRRMARYALYGALIVWLAIALFAMVGVWLSMKGQQEAQRFTVVLVTGIGMIFIAFLYAGAGSLAAVAGGWLGMKMLDREQERMTRQDMLERYFTLQARLHTTASARTERMPWADLIPVLRFQQHPYLWSLALGLMLSTVQTVLVGTLGLDRPEVFRSGSMVGVIEILLLIAISLASFMTYVAIGFFTNRVPKAVLCALIYSLGGLLPTLIPLGSFGLQYYADRLHLVQQGVAIPFFCLVSAIAAVGANVQNRALREKGIQGNDQASIIAEMLRIQWRLADHVSQVCVMVVDAAKSSVMKAEADPLAVEYSFREYQEWLESIGRKFGGRVHSTAGDGAVISFENCEDALEASRMIQSDLTRFNRDDNRLKSPFRLRIGLHTGQIAGDIDEVQFTEVIDIAAHVQDVAPIAGIAVTDDVAASLPHEQVIPLAVEVDGHRVFLVMQPAT